MKYTFYSKCQISLMLIGSFLTRELRTCARASCRYDVKNGTRSLDWSIPVNFFPILGFYVHLIVFGE